MAHNKRRRTMSNTRLKDELIKLTVNLFDVAQREINEVKKELNHLKSSVATINARYRKQKSRVKIPNKISDVTEGNADVAEGNAKTFPFDEQNPESLDDIFVHIWNSAGKTLSKTHNDTSPTLGKRKRRRKKKTTED
jgi:hypothetical protein